MLRGVPAQIGVENGRVSDQLIFDLFFEVLESVPELVLHVVCCESGAGLDLCGLGQATIPRRLILGHLSLCLCRRSQRRDLLTLARQVCRLGHAYSF